MVAVFGDTNIKKLCFISVKWSMGITNVTLELPRNFLYSQNERGSSVLTIGVCDE